MRFSMRRLWVNPSKDSFSEVMEDRELDYTELQ